VDLKTMSDKLERENAFGFRIFLIGTLFIIALSILAVIQPL